MLRCSLPSQGLGGGYTPGIATFKSRLHNVYTYMFMYSSSWYICMYSKSQKNISQYHLSVYHSVSLNRAVNGMVKLERHIAICTVHV